MPRGPAGRWITFPGRLEQPSLVQSNEDGIEGARLQPDLLTEIVSMPPAGRISGQRLQEPERLRREAARTLHPLILSI